MQTFRYPEDYLSKKGNIIHCWEVHKERMKKIGKPYVDYDTFYWRVKKKGRDLYRAIHTPLDYRKTKKKYVWKIWLRTERFRFIYLFKPNGLRRSKGHKHLSKG